MSRYVHENTDHTVIAGRRATICHSSIIRYCYTSSIADRSKRRATHIEDAGWIP